MQPIGGFLRIAITDAFETAKTELGLAHNEPRSWHGWHRHVSPVMLDFALLMVIRHKADTLTSPQKSQGINHRDRWRDGHAKKSDIEFVAVCLWRTGIRKWVLRSFVCTSQRRRSLFILCGGKYSVAQKVESSAAVHGSFDDLQPVD